MEGDFALRDKEGKQVFTRSSEKHTEEHHLILTLTFLFVP